MKRITKTFIAVMLAAAMLTACAAKTEDVSADLGNELTAAGEAETEKTETTKATTEATTTTAATTEVTEPENAANTVFEENDSYGVKDKSGNVIVKPIYEYLEANEDGTYFLFRLNYKKGVINTSGDMVTPTFDNDGAFILKNDVLIRGVDSYSYPKDGGNLYWNWKNANATYNVYEIYSLSENKLISECNTIKFLDKDIILVYGFGEDNTKYLKIIDSKGNEVKDLKSDSPLGDSDLRFSTFAFGNTGDDPIPNENTWFYVLVDGASQNDVYWALVNSKGETLNGWNDTAYPNEETLIYNTNNILIDGNIYDYSGKLQNAADENYKTLTADVLESKENPGTLVRLDKTEIGKFSEYECKDNAIIVTDTDGLFKGVIIGDELMYPCEYTDAEFEDDDTIRLSMGGTDIFVSTETGEIVE